MEVALFLSLQALRNFHTTQSSDYPERAKLDAKSAQMYQKKGDLFIITH